MKHISTVLILFLAFPHKIFASEERGYYVNLNNDTIRGRIKVYECTALKGAETIRFDNVYDRQFKMLFVDSKGAGHDLTPDTVSAVIIFEGESKGAYQSCKTFNSEHIFLRYEVYGKARLFRGFFVNQLYVDILAQTNKSPNGTCSSIDQRYYIQKEQGKITALDDVLFKKFLCDFFEDVPELVQKIKTGIYKEEDLKTMVMEYNYWARHGHSP